MNIFEALEKGNGKAMLFSQKGFESSYVYYESGRFFWSNEKGGYVNIQSLRGNNWIPYVPCGTSCVCENIQSGGCVEVDFNQKCIKCGKQFNFVLAKTKTKHKEVFENVKWYRTQWNIIYPAPIGINQEDSNKKLLNKPPMKMTLEWEE